MFQRVGTEKNGKDCKNVNIFSNLAHLIPHTSGFSSTQSTQIIRHGYLTKHTQFEK